MQGDTPLGVTDVGAVRCVLLLLLLPGQWAQWFGTMVKGNQVEPVELEACESTGDGAWGAASADGDGHDAAAAADQVDLGRQQQQQGQQREVS